MRLMRLMHRSTSDNLVPSEAGRREAAAIYIGEVAHGAGGTVLRSGQDRVKKEGRTFQLSPPDVHHHACIWFLIQNSKNKETILF